MMTVAIFLAVSSPAWLLIAMAIVFILSNGRKGGWTLALGIMLSWWFVMFCTIVCTLIFGSVSYGGDTANWLTSSVRAWMLFIPASLVVGNALAIVVGNPDDSMDIAIKSVITPICIWVMIFGAYIIIRFFFEVWQLAVQTTGKIG